MDSTNTTIDTIALDAEVEKLEKELGEERAKVLIASQLVRALPISFEGFRWFVWCTSKFWLPRHAEEWARRQIELFLRPAESGVRGLLNKAFRGSTKSFEQEHMAAYLLGKNPWGSGLIIQARESEAKRTSKFIADMISGNAGWKLCFPNMVPDEERGWSLDGYYVKDTSVEGGKWMELTSQDHGRDPSILAVPITGGAIGTHPTLFLSLDDIHDDQNSSSKIERAAIVRKLQSDILPTMSRAGRKPLLMASYTPWADDDGYTLLESLGWFEQIVTPVYKISLTISKSTCRLGDEDIELTWPEVFTVDEILRWKRLGEREFGRMYLCDLSCVKGRSLPFSSYEEKLVEIGWPKVGGVDPTNVDRPVGDSRRRSSFALCILAKHPMGGAIVEDGILVPCSQLEAEQYIWSAQARMGYLFTMVESVGGGAGFIQTLARNPRLKIRESGLSGIAGRVTHGNKHNRFEREVAPWFENGTIRISTKDTPYLNALRRLFDRFYDLDERDEAFDAGDALYHAMRGIPEVLMMPSMGDELPSTQGKAKTPNPWNALGWQSQVHVP